MLKPSQIGELIPAIVGAFDLNALTQFLYIRMNGRLLANFAPGASIDFQVFTILTKAKMEGWDDELIYGLVAERPKNTVILKIAYDLGISVNVFDDTSSSIISRAGLEVKVNSDPSFDAWEIIQGISENKRRVCRIQISGNGTNQYGTGFLVGNNLLLSNYHVFEKVIDDSSLAKYVTCKFDYEITPGGKEINKGIEVGLDITTPVLAFSKYSKYDATGSINIDDVEWPTDKMDYALVKLNREIGDEPFGPNAQLAVMSEKRGWIKPPIGTPLLSNGSHMFIFQHPDSQPMKIAMGFSQVKGCDKNGMRVRYKINTLGGSSGAPCFDHKFNWVAMHNMGDPNYFDPYNQGIPTSKIVADLATKSIIL